MNDQEQADTNIEGDPRAGDAIERLETEINNLKHRAETAEAERDKALAAAAEMQDVLGMDKAWPLVGVLNRLSLAAQHLFKGHDCDCGGHEDISHCIKLAESYSEKLHALSTDCGQGWLSPDKAKVLREALERIQLCSSSNHDLALEIARNAIASIQ